MEIKRNGVTFSFFAWGLMLCTSSILLTACATETRRNRLDESLSFYASTIRWGDFEGAKKFYKNRESWSQINFGQLKTIKITSYDEKSRVISRDGHTLSQSVYIRYYDSNVGKELELTDAQTWGYDEEQEVWMLTSPFPAFTH